MDKLRMKFSAFNLHFDRPSLDFLGSRKPAHEGIKYRYSRKSRFLPLLASLSWKRLHIGMGVLVITTSTIVTSFSVVSTWMTLKDPELSK